METEFRRRISNHVAALPVASASFRDFNTSPFVLAFYAKQRQYSLVGEIERDILPAKLFSSMETSAGRMVQDVVLPVYGWEGVESTMHSASSVLDARLRDAGVLKLATLKSGPRCLNDEMSKDLADDIVGHAEQWAEEAGVDQVEFTYGVLYGTQRLSNKKDWHILRNIVETRGTRFVIEHPRQKWGCAFRIRGTRVNVSIRIGKDWWTYLGGPSAFVEVMSALIRACVPPAKMAPGEGDYTISDLAEIVSLESVDADYNVGLLQRSQLQWLFFLARHFCDVLKD
jgi:hypothetical protein